MLTSGLKFILLLTLVSQAAPASDDLNEKLKQINERYDDFFRFREAQDERLRELNRGRDERKAIERKYYQMLEDARKEYVKSRKPKASDEPLRLRWEAEQKERAAEHELLRKRYVKSRDEIDRYLRKGRAIPELKEFDLEGY